MSDQSVVLENALVPARGRSFALAAAIGASACWGLATVMSKEALLYAPPLTLFVIQLTASIAFLSSAILFGRRRIRWSLRGLLGGATGLMEPGMAYMLGMIGLKFTSATNASVIMSSEPILIVLIAWLLLKEPIHFRVLLSVLAAILGILLVTGSNTWNIRGGGAEHIGDLLILAGAACAASYVVISHRLVQNMEPLHLLLIQQGYGLIFALAVWGIGHLSHLVVLAGDSSVFADIPAAGWIWAVVSGIVQYAFAFWLYLIALKKLRANMAAVSLALIPVFGVGGAWMFLGEPLTSVKVAGATMIVLAMAGASWNSGGEG